MNPSELTESTVDSLRASGFRITPEIKSVVAKSISEQPREQGYWLGPKPSRVPILLSRGDSGRLRLSRIPVPLRMIRSVFGIRIFAWVASRFGWICLFQENVSGDSARDALESAPLFGASDSVHRLGQFIAVRRGGNVQLVIRPEDVSMIEVGRESRVKTRHVTFPLSHDAAISLIHLVNRCGAQPHPKQSHRHLLARLAGLLGRGNKES